MSSGTPDRRLPRSLRILGVLATLFLALPLGAIFVRVPWGSVWKTLSTSSNRSAMWVSLQTSVVSAMICFVVGVPLAWILARSRSRHIWLVRSLCILPMVLPPVVGGIALLALLGRRGVLGQYLYDWFGLSIPSTRTAVVLAQVFVALPFLVVAVESAFRQADVRLEDAARTLGASELYLFRKVALPMARPAIVSGIVLAWARALGEFGASITFAGSLPGRTQTLPMAVYSQLEIDYRGSLVLSVVMCVMSVIVLVALRDRWFRTLVS